MDDGGVLLEAEREYQKQYRLSRWWIEHRDGLRRAGIIAFAAVDAIILLMVGWGLLDGFIISEPEETRAVLELAAYGQSDLHAYAQSRAARDLTIGPASSVASSEGTFDLYATVTNVNADWWGEFTYAFTSSAGQTDPQTSFVLPGAEKPLMAFAVPSAIAPRSASLVISDMVWHHIDHHVTGDVDTWIADRINFAVEDALFETVDVGGKPVPRVTFTVRNDAPFSYYEPVFVIRLMRGSALVGFTATTLPSLETGTEESVAVNWFGTVPAANKVEVFADINPFDIAVYKALEGETTGDTRTRVFSRRR